MIQIDKDPEIAEDIAFVISKWGQPTHFVEADEATLTRLGHQVPDMLIRHWRVLGFSVFQNGLLTVTNPLEWQDTADEWIKGTELETLDSFIPLIKGAYGSLDLFGLENGHTAIIRPDTATFVGSREENQCDLDIVVRTSFGEDLERYDFYDDCCNFKKAFTKLGPLKKMKSTALYQSSLWVVQLTWITCKNSTPSLISQFCVKPPVIFGLSWNMLISTNKAAPFYSLN